MTLCELQKRMQLNMKYCIIGFVILLVLASIVYFLWKKRRENSILYYLEGYKDLVPVKSYTIYI